jgi:hypothetical protein
VFYVVSENIIVAVVLVMVFFCFCMVTVFFSFLMVMVFVCTGNGEWRSSGGEAEGRCFHVAEETEASRLSRVCV